MEKNEKIIISNLLEENKKVKEENKKLIIFLLEIKTYSYTELVILKERIDEFLLSLT